MIRLRRVTSDTSQVDSLDLLDEITKGIIKGNCQPSVWFC